MSDTEPGHFNVPKVDELPVWELERLVGRADHPIGVPANRVLNRIMSLRTIWSGVKDATDREYTTAADRLGGVIGGHLPDNTAGYEPGFHPMPLPKTTDYLVAKRRYDAAEFLTTDLAELFVLGLIAAYDGFVGDLARGVFALTPEKLQEISREFPARAILGLKTADQITSFVIDKEVESLLRSDHVSQLEWFERKAGIALKQFPNFDRFREVMERRNLIAHNDGRVTARYLAEFPAADLAVGDRLQVDAAYVDDACCLIYEVAIKLSQILWRVLTRDEEVLSCDRFLSRVCYTLLVFEDWDLARVILDFAITLRTYSNDQERRIFFINRAQCEKWAGDRDACLAVLALQQWEASADPFRLAVAVLKDDFRVAEGLMRLCGETRQIDREAFQQWPLFREFRQTDQFLRAYASIVDHEAAQGPSTSPQDGQRYTR